MDNSNEKMKGLLIRDDDPTNDEYVIISTHIVKIKKGETGQFIFEDKHDCDVTFTLSFASTIEEEPQINYNLKDPANMELVFLNIDDAKFTRNNNRILIGSYQKTKQLYMNFAIYPLMEDSHIVIVEFYYRKHEDRQ